MLLLVELEPSDFSFEPNRLSPSSMKTEMKGMNQCLMCFLNVTSKYQGRNIFHSRLTLGSRGPPFNPNVQPVKKFGVSVHVFSYKYA